MSEVLRRTVNVVAKVPMIPKYFFAEVNGYGNAPTSVWDEKLDQEARVLLEAVVCQGGSEKAVAPIAGESVCEGTLVEVHIAAAFARVSAELQRTSVVL